MPTPFIKLHEPLREIIENISILQAPLGDDLFVSMRLDEATAGTAEKPGVVLEDLLFFPTRFLLNPATTNIFDKWYPGGFPFTETTVNITWSMDLNKPVVTFIRNRSLISIVMPLNKPGKFKELLDRKDHFPGPQEKVTALLHRADAQNKPQAGFFHYTFGTKLDGHEEMTPRILKQNCIRAMVWDPRGFLHTMGEVDAKITEITNPAEPGGKVTDLPVGKKARMPNPGDASEKDDVVAAQIQRMSLTIQLNLVITENAVNPEKFLREDDGTGNMPVMARCNVGQAIYDPTTEDFVLNGQHYTLANWPQNTIGDGGE